MVLTGFAEIEFVQKGRDVKGFEGKEWTKTGHNLDFLFARDGVTYGIEVKNALGYIEKKELDIKIELCMHLGVRPVFVVRMMPKTWIQEVVQADGFVLIMGYQLYHWTHRELAKKVNGELGLPVDAPKKLQNQTMGRFLKWHIKQIGVN
jgi:hypothetical protein